MAGADPNKERDKLVREAEEANRAEMRREAARQKMRERQQRKGISADYLEDNDDDENSFSLNAIKVCSVFKCKKCRSEGFFKILSDWLFFLLPRIRAIYRGPIRNTWEK